MEKKHINVIVVIVVRNYMTIFSKMEVVLMNLKVVAKVFGSLIPAIIGTYLLVKDYIAAANHPEWSVSPMVMWV